jgi:hypothetical protein
MELEPGRSYRAKTADGDFIKFTVVMLNDGVWPTVDLDSQDGPEPNVFLNTRLLLWISLETRRAAALSKAADEVIEALEQSNLESPEPTM